VNPLPVCPNCGKPAKYIHVYADGDEILTCGKCRAGEPTGLRELQDDDIPTAIVPPLTVAEAAKAESVSERTVYRWLEAGELGEGAWKRGSVWKIDSDALKAHRLQGPRTRTHNPAPGALPSRRRSVSAPDSDWPT